MSRSAGQLQHRRVVTRSQTQLRVRRQMFAQPGNEFGFHERLSLLDRPDDPTACYSSPSSRMLPYNVSPLRSI